MMKNLKQMRMMIILEQIKKNNQLLSNKKKTLIETLMIILNLRNKNRINMILLKKTIKINKI